jgi:hypothetical protein
MTMIAIHSSALNSKVSSYHEFLLRYSKQSKVVYGFVEGKDDPTFYRGFIDLLLPEDWTVELWPAGNKDQVYCIHADLDWRSFPKKRVCFFVDRDLSDIIPEPSIKDSNIYVTMGYSIENDVVNKTTCQRILSELCGFANADHAEVESACTLFEKELEIFLKEMIPIMAWILSWRMSGKRPNLNDILMRDLFSFRNGHLQPNPMPKGKRSVAQYLHEQCNIDFDPAVDINNFETEFRRNGRYKKFTRGKYIFWFMIEFCNAVHRDAVVLFKSILKLPKKNVTLSSSNGMAVIGSRARFPAPLRKFLKSTYCAYIKQLKWRTCFNLIE